MRLWFAVSSLCLTLTGPLSGQVIRGQVLDARTDSPIPSAQVSLVAAEGIEVTSTLADSEGRFLLSSPEPGPHHLYGEGLGFLSSVEGPLTLSPGDTLVVEFRLRPSPVPVESIEISVERRTPALERVGFYRRAESGQGHFIDRAVIEKRTGARTLAHLLYGIPGVRVGKTGEVSLTGMASLYGRCSTNVYLDGLRIEDAGWTRSVHPMDVEGLEVYRRPSEIPPQYGGPDSGCGVILIWTRK